MDSTKLTVAMIDTAVSRGLKDMENNPKRTIRNLADMGKRFSTGNFQQVLFEIFQKLLQNEESPYYDLIQYVLLHTDHENLKKFGINMGYYSWTHYAKVIRANSKKEGRILPWKEDFIYCTDDQPNASTSLANIRKRIADVRKEGINTFSITLTGQSTPPNNLFSIFEDFDESAFLLFLGDTQITVAQQGMLKKCGNVLLCINAASNDAVSTCEALTSSGNLYSIYYNYVDQDIVLLKERSFYEKLKAFPSCMLILIPANESVMSAGPIVKEIRLEQKSPYFIWDFPYDNNLISSIICK